jgi:hypothetical protein
MNPLVIIVPAGIGVGLYFLLRPSTPAYATPPPGTPTAQSGGPRYQTYMQQLQGASLAYTAGSLFDKSATSSAAQQFKGTLDVVGQMAAADQKANNITVADLNAINSQIAVLKKQIG